MLIQKLNPEKWGQVSRYSGAIGCLAFAIGIIISRFASYIISDFMVGLLLGISVVANLLAISLFGKYKRYQMEIQREAPSPIDI
jgi:uncharacterized membrane protein